MLPFNKWEVRFGAAIFVLGCLSLPALGFSLVWFVWRVAAATIRGW